MAPIVTVLGQWAEPLGETRVIIKLLVSNKPLDNRSIAPQAKHDVDVLRVSSEPQFVTYLV